MGPGVCHHVRRRRAMATDSPTSPSPMLPVADVIKTMSHGKGFDRVHAIPGSTYKDNSTIIIIPTRGTIHHKIVSAWMGLMAPMNQKRAGPIFAVGHEVG